MCVFDNGNVNWRMLGRAFLCRTGHFCVEAFFLCRTMHFAFEPGFLCCSGCPLNIMLTTRNRSLGYRWYVYYSYFSFENVYTITRGLLERLDVLNHRQLDDMFNGLFRLMTAQLSKLRSTVPLWEGSNGFSTQVTSDTESFSMSWRRYLHNKTHT